MLALEPPSDFTALLIRCAPTVHVQTMRAIVRVESSNRPYVIAVVDGPQVKQPRTMQDAIAKVQELERKGYNYSVGYAQVNKQNFARYGLTLHNMFEPCTNLRAGSKILEKCYISSGRKYKDEQRRLRAAYSCYYSGNFLRGFKPDKPGALSYVDKVIKTALAKTDSPIADGQLGHPPNLGPAWRSALK